MNSAIIRAWWWQRQGLGIKQKGGSPQAVLQASGWSRSVGGCAPYLTLLARGEHLPREIDAAVAACKIHELPSVRGCTYVVPASDYALALQAGQRHGVRSDMENAIKHCGVIEAEIEELRQLVLAALAAAPLDPAEIKEALGSAVRHLGDAGKKRGLTTTLSLALSQLQSFGEIRRIPVNGRLDQQRYRYERWQPSPLAGRTPLSEEELALELGRRFFSWGGPATLKHFSFWAGLPVKAAGAAARALSLVPVSAGDDRLLFPADLEALQAFTPPREPQYALVSSLDNLLHLRRNVGDVLAQEDSSRDGVAKRALGGLADLPNHAIFDRGELIGLWDYDGKERIVWKTFAPPTAELRAEVARVEGVVRDHLGDARSFSLDSPESRTSRLDSLRG
jgi:hypothetical protein